VARLDRPDSWAAPTRGVGPCANRQAYSPMGAHQTNLMVHLLLLGTLWWWRNRLAVGLRWGRRMDRPEEPDAWICLSIAVGGLDGWTCSSIYRGVASAWRWSPGVVLPIVLSFGVVLSYV
jgi:hypothetical protein